VLVISVIIPAYNEEAGIRRQLEGLVGDPTFGDDIEVIVAANGCSDRTAEVARSFGVRVIESSIPSKTVALNAAEAVASGFPRIYLDADIAVTPALLRELAAAVSDAGTYGATAKRVVDASRSRWPVRAFYAINTRLPALQNRLFGRGVIALAKPARDRFGEFPDIIADDMFLDAVVGADERCEIASPVVVLAPATVSELVRRVARSRAGNEQFWAWSQQAQGVRFANPVTGSASTSWLRDVVAPRPTLWPAAFCYVTVLALVALRRKVPGWSASSGWGTRGR
jgi:glycosyltransferase involved in cell wall biosynthesis